MSAPASLEDQIFRKLLDTAPDAVVVVDEAGKIVLVNLQTERMFDYAREELLGREVEVLIPERVRGSHVGHRHGFDESRKVAHRVRCRRCRDVRAGSRPIPETLAPGGLLSEPDA